MVLGKESIRRRCENKSFRKDKKDKKNGMTNNNKNTGVHNSLGNEPFFMEIHDIFSITGRGTVVTGTIKAGAANTGDAVEIISTGSKKLTSTITGVEKGRIIRDRGEAGDEVGLFLRGINEADIDVGMVVVKPGSVKPEDLFTVNNISEMDTFVESGDEKLDSRDFEGAIEDYTKAIKIDSTNDVAYYGRGFAKENLDDLLGAIEDYTKAIEIDPNYSGAYYGRGGSKLFLGDLNGAIADFTKASDLSPKSGLPFRGRAIAKGKIKDYQGAIADFTRAIVLDPKDDMSYRERSHAKVELDDYKGAIVDLTRAIELDPNYASAYSDRGYIKSKLKDYRGAIIDFTKAIEINPNYSNPYKHRGVAKYELKDYKEALVDLTKAVEINPNYKDAYEQRAVIYAELGNMTEAIRNFKKTYSLTTDYSEQTKIRQELDKLIPQFNSQFVDLPYQQRKIIVIDDEYKTASTNAFVVLDKANLPPTVNFPVGHPIEQELYIAHPFTKSSYMPYSDYDDSLFVDRYEAFKLFIQCLGAKSMTIEVIKGSEKSSSIINNSSSDNSDSRTGSVSAGFKVFSGSVAGSSSNSSASNYNDKKGLQVDSQATRTTTQGYNPTKKPYKPLDLIWFNNEPTWQRLYEQRMAGSLLQHSETWSLKSNYSISQREETSLKSAFKDFLGGSIGVNMFSVNGEMSSENNRNVEELVEKTFNKSESIEWSIKIEFEPIENLLEGNIESDPVKKVADNSSTINKDEEEYSEELKFMLEDDGVIDDKERSILERFRERKGISKERAVDLEKNLLSFGNLLEDEKEYLEEFKEILNEGEITEKERRILSRMASRLGISETRVNELESLN